MVAVVVGVSSAGAVTAWRVAADPTSEARGHTDDVVPSDGAPIIGEAPIGGDTVGADAIGDDTIGDVTALGDPALAAAAAPPPMGPLPDGTAAEPVSLTDPPLNSDGVRMLTFDLLASFDYEVAMDTPEEAVERRWQMPAVIRKLDDQRVEIEGYMLPLDFERGRVQSFYLNRDTNACCFGIIPPVNQVIRVHLPDKKGVPNYSNIPIIVTGTFQIMESTGDFGFVTSIFRIDADTVEKSTWQ